MTDAEPEPPSWPRRLLRGAAVALALVGFAGALLTAIAWLVLVKGVGTERLIRTAGTLMMPEAWSVSVGGAQGGLLARARLVDVEVRGPGVEVRADTILLRGRPYRLLTGMLSVDSVLVASPEVTLVSRASTSSAEAARPEPSRPDDGPPVDVVVQRLLVRDGHVAWRDLQSDTARFQVENLDARGAFRLDASGLSVRVDSLVGGLRRGSTRSKARLTLSGTLDGQALRVGRLRLVSPRSDVRATGTLPLPARAHHTRGLRFHLVASPLDASDLPGSAALGDVAFDVDLEARGREGGVDLSGTVHGPGGARFSLDGDVRVPEGASTSPFVHLDTRIEGLRPSAFRRGLPNLAMHGRATFQSTALRTGGWTASLRTPAGALDGSGRIDWSSDAVVADSTELRLAGLDLAGLSTRLPRTALTGRVRVRAVGPLSPDAAHARVDVDLGGSRLLDERLETATARLTLAQGRVSGTMRVGAYDGLARLEVQGSPFAETPSWAVRARTVTPPPGQPVRSASVDGTVVGDSASYHAEARLPDSARVAASGWLKASEVPGGPVTWALTRATFRDLDPSTLAALPRGRLTGSLEAEGSGISPSTLTADAALRIEPSMVASMRLGGARVDASIAGHRMDAHGTVGLAHDGRLDVVGQVRLDPDTLRFDARLDGRIPPRTPAQADTGAAVSLDTLQAVLGGTRATGSRAVVAGTVRVRGARWGDATIDTLRAELALDAGEVRLDTLDLTGNVLSARGSGALPRRATAPPGRAQVSVRLVDLQPLGAPLGGRRIDADSGFAVLRLRGRTDSLAVAAHARLNALLVDRITARGVDARIEGTWAATDSTVIPLQGVVRLDAERVGMPDADVRQVRVTLGGGRDSVRVDASSVVDDQRRAELLLQVDPRPERRAARLERMALELDEDRWQLEHPALFDLRDGWRVAGFALSAGDQRITVDGGIGGSDSLDLKVQIDSTDVGTVSDLLGLPGLMGWVSTRLELSGKSAAPTGTLVARGAFHREGEDAGRVDARLTSEAGALAVDLRLTHPDGGPLTARGTVPIGTPASDDPPAPALDLDVRADSFAIAWLSPFVPESVVRDISGRLDSEVRVRGSLADPALQGSVSLARATLSLPPLGVLWEDAHARLRAEGRRFEIEEASLRGGQGDARASGFLELTTEGPSLDAHVEMHELLAIARPAYRAVVSGSVDVGGRSDSLAVAGSVRMRRLDVWLGERATESGLEDVTLTQQDLETLRDRFGVVTTEDRRTSQTAERLHVDLDVSLGRDSWIRKRTNPEMAVPFDGDVSVMLEPGTPPELEGTVRVVEGRGFVEQFGKRFELASGTVDFHGAPADADVDLRARYTIPSRGNPDDAEATILLGVEGTTQELRLTLSSDPPMENADIVSYIATGRPAARGLALGSGDEHTGVLTTGTELALDRMVGVIEGAAADRVGLDVVEIQRDGLRGATLVAGKYVTPDLYLGFAQPVTLNESESTSGGVPESRVEIEYAALRWLVLNVEGSGSDIRFFLRGRRAY